MPQVGFLPRQSAIISGVVAPGAVLRFYQTGTSTPQSAYTDAALSNAVTSLTADSAGLLAKWYLNPNATANYRYTLETSAGAVYYTEDDVSRFPVSQDEIGAALYPTTAAESAASVTPSDKSFANHPVLEAERYGVAADGVTDDLAAIDRATSVATQLGGAIVQLPPGTICVSDNIDIPSGVWLRGSGRDVTIIQNLNTQAIDVISIGRNTQYAAVTDLTIDGNGDASFAVQGLSFNDSRYCRVERIRVKDCGTSTRTGNVMSVVAHDGETFQTEHNVFRDIIINDDDDAAEFGLRVYWGITGGTPTNFVRHNLFENILITGCNKNGLECAGPGVQFNTFRRMTVRDTGMWSGAFDAAFGARYNTFEDLSVINYNQAHVDYAGTLSYNRKCFSDTGFDTTDIAAGNTWRNLRVDGFSTLNTGSATIMYLLRSNDCHVQDVKARNVTSSTGSMRAIVHDGDVNRASIDGFTAEGEFDFGQLMSDEIHECSHDKIKIRSSTAMFGIRSTVTGNAIEDCEWHNCWYINTGTGEDWGCNLSAASNNIKFIGGGFENFTESGVRAGGTATNWLVSGVTFKDIAGGNGRAIEPLDTSWVLGPNLFDNCTTDVYEPGRAYTASNVTSDRTYNADSTSTEELADIVGTLIAQLQSGGYIA